MQTQERLPTFDELLAQPDNVEAAGKQLPTFDEYLKSGPSEPERVSIPWFHTTPEDIAATSEAQKQYLKTTATGRILSAVGHGLGEGFGDGPLGLSPESRKEFAQAGILPDYEKGQVDLLTSFNEALITPLAAGMDALMRSGSAVFTAAESGAQQAGEEAGFPRTGRGMAELIHFASEGAPGLNIFAAGAGRVPRVIEDGNRARVFDGEAQYMGTKEPTPMQEANRLPATPEPPPPSTIHEVARELSPNVFREYDALEVRRNSYGQFLRDLSAKRLETVESSSPYLPQIAEIEAKLEDANTRKAKIYQAQIDELRAKHELYVTENIEKDTPDIAKVRESYNEADYRMRDLAPKISKAYREAQRRIPEVEEVKPSLLPEEPPAVAEAVAEPKPEVAPAPETSPVLDNIVKDISAKLTAAGRSAEEAEAAAQLISSHYQARSERFGGKLGNAEEMYKRDSAHIKAGKGEGKERPGRIRLSNKDAKNTITLMKSADASTFIHETGHDWLNELVRDAKHELAPAELVKDVKTLRNWLGVEEGAEISRKQHEQFARGFERYMMEGTAPNKALAKVFAQFKAWLTQIYRTVERLRSPINDDIRDVFNRLLANTEEAVVTPERGQLVDDTAVSGVNTPVTGEVAPKAESVLPEVKAPEASQVVSAAKPTVASPNQRMGRAESNLIDKAGNIRLDNLNTPEDVNAVLREVSNENDAFRSARREVITDAQALDLADALGMDAKTLNFRKIGEAFNAEQVIAARKLLIQSATGLRDVMAKAADGAEADILSYAEAKARHIMIQEQVSGITAEAGRALRAFKQLEGMKEAEMLGEFLKENTGMDLFQLRREAQLGKELDTPEKLSKFINDSQKPTYMDMATEYWINALLSGPVTHVKNILGNSLIAFNSIAETAIASGIGKALKSVDKIEMNEVKARWFGLQQGAVEGLKTAAAIIRSDEAITGAHTVEDAHKQAIPGMAGKIIRTPTRFLSAEDEIFKAIGYRQELNAQAYRVANKEGLEGKAFTDRVADLLRDPSEEMMKAAKANAKYQTFTNSLGPLGRSAQSLSNAHPLAKFILPFVRTPANILKYAGERTPLAVFSEQVRANLKGVNGERARDTQLARIAMGSTVGLAAFSLASQGLMTGGGPSDPKHKAFLRNTGWQPYSLKIGNGYYSYQWLDPFSTMMGSLADMAETMHEAQVSEEDDKKESIPAMVMGSISQNILSKLSLRGVSDAIQAMTNSDQYGDKYIQGFVSSFVPGVVNQASRITDPTLRETRSVLDAIKARIPFVREGLFPKRDVWGEPIVLEGALGPDIISPVYQTSLKVDPVNQMLLNLHYYPSKPDRTMSSVELTDKQYDDFARVSGRLMKMRLDAVARTPGFTNIPQVSQLKVVKRLVDESREAARKYTMMKNPDIIQKAVEEKRKAITGKSTGKTTP